MTVPALSDQEFQELFKASSLNAILEHIDGDRQAADKAPRSTIASRQEAMAKALKTRGFTFCGPVIVYAFMQAVGMVNDHGVECFRHREIQAMKRG